jgi:hypothetical protein
MFTAQERKLAIVLSALYDDDVHYATSHDLINPYPRDGTTLWRMLCVAAVCFIFLGLAAPTLSAREKVNEDNQVDKQQLEFQACGPAEKEVMYTAGTDKSTRPTPEPPEGKAMVYVVRPTLLGNKVQTKLAVDGEWKGVNRGNNYFFFTLDPGEHHLCSQSENRSVGTITVEAGKSYFLQQHIRMGMKKARNTIEILSEEEGRKALAKCHLSTWEVK